MKLRCENPGWETHTKVTYVLLRHCLEQILCFLLAAVTIWCWQEGQRNSNTSDLHACPLQFVSIAICLKMAAIGVEYSFVLMTTNYFFFITIFCHLSSSYKGLSVGILLLNESGIIQSHQFCIRANAVLSTYFFWAFCIFVFVRDLGIITFT